MNIKKLKEMIKDLPDDMKVFVSDDAEGYFMRESYGGNVQVVTNTSEHCDAWALGDTSDYTFLGNKGPKTKKVFML